MSDIKPISTYVESSRAWENIGKDSYASARLTKTPVKDNQNRIGAKYEIKIRIGADKYRRRGAFTKILSGIKKIGRVVLKATSPTDYKRAVTKNADRKVEREHDAFVGQTIKKFAEMSIEGKSSKSPLKDKAFRNQIVKDLTEIYRKDTFQKGR